jgi:glycosyltransferase involved in cell wall biosynthesis
MGFSQTILAHGNIGRQWDDAQASPTRTATGTRDLRKTGDKPKVALLSTWNETCGIAHYAYFLERELSRHYHVAPIALRREIFFIGNSSDQERQVADNRVTEIVAQIRREKFDAIILQFEPSLFGRNIRQVCARIRRIVDSAKPGARLVVDFHYVNRDDTDEERLLRTALRGPRAVARRVLAQGRQHFWQQLYGIINGRARRGPVSAIAHSFRDAEALKIALPDAHVMHGPLSYMDEAFVAALPRLVATSHLPELMPQRKPDARYIGCFGFYSPYKGFETAISALDHLPQNYELLMFAGVHDTVSTLGDGRQQYLMQLLRLVEEKKLASRVHFIGTVSDDDMLLSLKLCHAVSIPYQNSPHTASGPAAMAIELGCLTFASRSTQFIELKKYFPDQFHFVDIGNHIELAQKIQALTRGFIERDVGRGLVMIDYPTKPRHHHIGTLADSYRAAIERSKAHSS